MSHVFSTAHCTHCSHSIKCMLLHCVCAQARAWLTCTPGAHNTLLATARGREREWERRAGMRWRTISFNLCNFCFSPSVSSWIFLNGASHVVVVVHSSPSANVLCYIFGKSARRFQYTASRMDLWIFKCSVVLCLILFQLLLLQQMQHKRNHKRETETVRVHY